ncbi:aminotransferase class III-fold pyridoxal phosphate-dependent enzyme [Rhodobacteraceae bacterium KMM 6894]|nr:aminotransferase class III-fold pyridoxal phosphate-dependent enzyme [Rhodobacteraceae bacterium KMM 6894]
MTDHWANMLDQTWGIQATLSPLNGEYDLNFAVSSTPGHVLKVMRRGCDPAFVDMQARAIRHILSAVPDLPIPDVVATPDGTLMAQIPDAEGHMHTAWLLHRAPGIAYADMLPKTPDLATQLGGIVGRMDAALADFQHPDLARDFKWNLMQGGWITDRFDVITDPARRALLDGIAQQFAALKPALEALPQQAIHNDVNDYNILALGSLKQAPQITGIIDFGDMCAAPRICDLAIAAAYVVLDHPNPEAMLTALVAAYHAANPLTAQELDMLWPLLKMRLAVSLVNSTIMAQEVPDDPYVVVSQGPAWRFLEGHQINEAQIAARLRVACGLAVVDGADRVLDWLDAQRGGFAPIVGTDLTDAPMESCSVEATSLPQDPFNITAQEAATLGSEHAATHALWLGHYGDPRLIYTEDFFRLGPWKASDRRTVHMGVDIFAPAGTPVHAPMAGTVAFAGYRPSNLDYGGLIMLRHGTPEGAFFTLYGHMSRSSVETLSIGQQISKGQQIAVFGDLHENGAWAPHLHFQMALGIDGMKEDWPGAVSPDDLAFWTAICPNPAALMNVPDAKVQFTPVSRDETLEERRANFGANLKLSYQSPVMLLRGWRHHLFDEWGRPYLDAYNNVPHVGHAHPRIRAVAYDQLGRMNSNTRYLHPAQGAFAKAVLRHMPEGLDTCFFVNSGSEANELALRLARAQSGGRDMITPDHGYHGNTTGAIDISAYKFNAKGGVGQPDWVQLVDVADDYRGKFRRDDPDRAEKYAALVDPALQAITARGGKLAGFICETFPSVGGQIIPPKGYLAGVYKRIRAAGGVCIADEVQTGLGRLGDYYFGFQEQGALPDIVVLGKPIGNGHPLGVVVTTRAIADAFAQGPEYFSTFGGSTLSCRIGKEVLDIVEDEGLMENARLRGKALLAGLRDLQADFDEIGDVRGYGLFIGVDLVSDRESRAPGTDIARYVINRMRDHRILIGAEGPADNILKIRPPLTIDADGVDMILHTLRVVLAEVRVLRGCNPA